jgi:6-phosphogluconate dehydrogenase
MPVTIKGVGEGVPMRDRAAYAYDRDVRDVTKVWRRGSLVASWLLDLTAAALAESPTLEGSSGQVQD